MIKVSKKLKKKSVKMNVVWIGNFLVPLLVFWLDLKESKKKEISVKNIMNTKSRYTWLFS